MEVLWPDDAVWYGGRIHDYDPVSGRHRVWYDDGEWEFVHLSEGLEVLGTLISGVRVA